MNNNNKVKVSTYIALPHYQLGREISWQGPWMSMRMHCIADQRRGNDNRTRSQYNVKLYGWSHFSAKREASLL